MATYLDEASPADSDPITLGAGAIRTFKQEMDALIQHHVQIPTTFTDNTTDKLDKILLHKWLGLPLPRSRWIEVRRRLSALRQRI